MPSAKPDKARIKAAVRARDSEELPDFFTPIKEAAQLAVSDGSITQSRAANFELLLSVHPYLDFFPYNMLRAALHQATDSGCWGAVVERDLLILITTLFAERYDGFPLQDLIKADLPTFGDIYPQLFDTPPASFTVAGKLCDFTGPFKDRSRRECYAQVDALGGTPSDMGWYTDCLFVADEHFHKRVISSALEEAVFTRMRQGTLRIYRESVMPPAIRSAEHETLVQMLKAEADAIRVLIYIAKADGQLMAAERKVITAACKVFTGDTSITEGQVKNLLSKFAPPSTDLFKRSIENICKRCDDTLKRKIMRAAETIVATQKNVADAEQEALDYMAKRFSKPE